MDLVVAQLEAHGVDVEQGPAAPTEPPARSTQSGSATPTESHELANLG